MTPASPRRYLETQILTASREQLLLMLYDGAIRFLSQGMEALGSGDLEGGHQAFVRAQRIVIELWCALNPQVDPELSKTLGGLYAFLYMRLVSANVQRDARAAEDALGILKSLREAWAEAAEKVRRGEADVDAPGVGVPVAG